VRILVGLFTSKDWVYTDGRKPLLMSAGPLCQEYAVTYRREGVEAAQREC